MTGLPCYKCAHRANVPGDCHSQCEAPLSGQEVRLIIVLADRYGLESGWFFFPYNYDPIWGPEKCPRFKEIQNE